MFVNKTNFLQVLRIYAYLSKSYEAIVPGILYFSKQDDYTLEMSSFLKTPLS